MIARHSSICCGFAAVLALGALAGSADPIDSPPQGPSLPTVWDTSHNAFGRVLPNAKPTDAERMHDGKRVFVRTWRPAGEGPALVDGLGPLFNAESCVSCHFKDGRGGPRATPQPTPLLVFRLDPGAEAHGWGEQLQDRAVGQAPEGRITINQRMILGQYADGTGFQLREPVYRVLGTKNQPRLSPRVPPTLVGIGLLESIAEATITSWADPEDRDGDGISGRARWLTSDTGRRLGRFGWKASQPSLDRQVAAALAEDMGITSIHRPGAAGETEIAETEITETEITEPEITAADFALLIDYLRLLAPPARRQGTETTVVQGERLFESIGCAACHRPRLITAAANKIAGPAALAEQTIEPYTDLLLHDLGEGLADDNIGEAGVETGEWRTAPLWGLGLMQTVNGGLYLLHDGRARSFEEAILWHGGEAQSARQHFLQLEEDERTALIAFLETL